MATVGAPTAAAAKRLVRTPTRPGVNEKLVAANTIGAAAVVTVGAAAAVVVNVGAVRLSAAAAWWFMALAGAV